MRFYSAGMSSRFGPLPSGFVQPCLPSGSKAPPSGKGWLHEIKHDDFRVIRAKSGRPRKAGWASKRSDPTSLEKAMDIAARLPLPSEEPKGEGDAPQGAGLVPRDIGDVLNGLNLCAVCT